MCRYARISQARSHMFYYIGRRALADITKLGGEVMDKCEGLSSSAPATAENASELSIFAKAC